MTIIDADKLKEKYPGRRSLNTVLDKEKPVTIAEQIENIIEEMCDKYCKIPYKYSANEWEDIKGTDECPCNNCPLNRLR